MQYKISSEESLNEYDFLWEYFEQFFLSENLALE